MRFGKLQSIGHNIADSLASGVGLPIGLWMTDIFGEISRTPEGYLTVDFLTGTSSGGQPSQTLTAAIAQYREALAVLCKKHGLDVSAFKTVTARYGIDAVHGPFYAVTVVDAQGRSSTDEYVGYGGAHLKRRP